MIPMRNKTIFKSRWWALIWSAGILWAAYDFAGTSNPDTDDNDALNVSAADADAQIAQLSNMIAQVKQ